MNYLLYILIPLLSLILTILDTSFFSFWEVWNATIISSFCFLMVVVILGHRKVALVFGAFSILFLSVFSSIPTVSLLAIYLIIPLLIFYIRQKVYFESSYIPAAIVFLLSGLVFRLVLLSMSLQFGPEVLISLFTFPIINLFVSMLLLWSAKRLNNNFVRP